MAARIAKEVVQYLTGMGWAKVDVKFYCDKT
jgi:hypothetical protein